MKDIEYKTEDKSTWARGPWDREPDKMQFTDSMTGLPCLIKRNGTGALCGYVGVPKDHPAYEKFYDNVDAQVHGGLTYSSFCAPLGDEAHSICHVVEDGEDDKVWWLGFDCAHYMDFSPRLYTELPEELRNSLNQGNKYRTVAYVKREIAGLAKQLKAMQ